MLLSTTVPCLHMLPLFSFSLLRPKSHDKSCQLWLAMTHQPFFSPISIPSCKSGVEGSPYRLHVQCLVNCPNPVWEVLHSHMLLFAICVFPTYTFISRIILFTYIMVLSCLCILVHTICTFSSFEWNNHIYLYLVHIHADVTILCKNLTIALIYMLIPL